MTGSNLAADYEYCAQVVRHSDHDRYLAALLMDGTIRPHILALYAFNAEVAQVRDRADQPLAGEVRLQWWRDAVSGTAGVDIADGPVASAIRNTIDAYGLPREQFAGMIEARMFDLYSDPMPDFAGVERYLASTACMVFDLATRIAEKESTFDSEISRFAGYAYGITGLLRSFPLHASRGQIFLPADVFARHGVTESEILSGQSSDALSGALTELRQLARDYLNKAKQRIETIPSAAKPVFLPLALAEAYLARMERGDYDPFKTRVEIGQLKRQWILWRAARKYR